MTRQTVIHLANPNDPSTACGVAIRSGVRAGNIDSQVNCRHCRQIIDSYDQLTPEEIRDSEDTGLHS
jgi:hypothetical protein